MVMVFLPLPGPTGRHAITASVAESTTILTVKRVRCQRQSNSQTDRRYRLFGVKWPPSPQPPPLPPSLWPGLLWHRLRPSQLYWLSALHTSQRHSSVATSSYYIYYYITTVASMTKVTEITAAPVVFVGASPIAKPLLLGLARDNPSSVFYTNYTPDRWHGRLHNRLHRSQSLQP